MGLLDQYAGKNLKNLPVNQRNPMGSKSWDDLYQMRLDAAGNEAEQARVAPYEHLAWAREQGKKGVLAPLVTGLLMEPGWQAAKALGVDEAFFDRTPLTTPPSMEQALRSAQGGLLGAGDALSGYLEEAKKLIKRSAM